MENPTYLFTIGGRYVPHQLDERAGGVEGAALHKKTNLASVPPGEG